MYKYKVDQKALQDKIFKKAYLLEEVKDKIEKVAFDVVRFKDSDNKANLWQVHKGDDGDYIVALYQDDGEKISHGSDWDVELNKSSSVDFYYKGYPVITLSAVQLGLPSTEVSKVKNYLPQKLAENKKMVQLLLNQMNKVAKEDLLKKYPELSAGGK